MLAKQSKESIAIIALTKNETSLVSGGSLWKKAGKAVGNINNGIDKIVKKVGEEYRKLRNETKEAVNEAAKEFQEGKKEV